MTEFDLQPSTDFLNDMETKLKVAETIRKYQEKQKNQDNGRDASLALRLINESLRRTVAEHFGVSRNTMMREGTTSTHIVYSQLSKFDVFVAILLQTALDPSLHSSLLN